MARYKIWNTTDTIYTLGEPYKFTPDEWKARYPWSEVEPCVINGEGAINGAFCMPLSDMIAQATAQGCDFSACETNEEKLAALEAFEDELATQAQKQATEEAGIAERQAAALEAIASGQTSEGTAAMNALLMGEEE